MQPTDDRHPPSAPPRAGGTAAAPAQPHPSAPADTGGPPPRRGGPRPVPPGVEYHRVLAGEKRRIGRGVLAIALLIGGLFAFSIAGALVAGRLDALMGRTNPAMGGTDYTPLFHAAVLAPIALLIPWSMLIQRWLYGVRGASLHSVLSRFRFDVFGRALLFIGPVWLAVTLASTLLIPKEQAYWSSVDLAALVAITLLLAPLQSAGEEYGLRGLVFRVAGSWVHGPRAALFLGVLVSGLVFTVIHHSTDPWLNLLYATIAVSLAVITWRTGGIETAVVAHALNNTLISLFDIAAHTEFDTLFERSAGSGSPLVLLPCLTLAAITAVVWLRTRATGPALTPALP